MLRLWYKAKSIYSLYKAGHTPPTKRSAAQFPRVKAPPVWASPSEIMGAFVLALRCAGGVRWASDVYAFIPPERRNHNSLAPPTDFTRHERRRS